MRVRYHPEFPKDLRKFEGDYQQVSESLQTRVREDVDAVIQAIIASPKSAGHHFRAGSQFVRAFRRRNLKTFPFFVLDGVTNEVLIFGAIIPTRSDPLTWLARFKPK